MRQRTWLDSYPDGWPVAVAYNGCLCPYPWPDALSGKCLKCGYMVRSLGLGGNAAAQGKEKTRP